MLLLWIEVFLIDLKHRSGFRTRSEFRVHMQERVTCKRDDTE